MVLLIASNDCMREKFVISDVIKTGLSAVRCDVTRGTEVDG